MHAPPSLCPRLLCVLLLAAPPGAAPPLPRAHRLRLPLPAACPAALRRALACTTPLRSRHSLCATAPSPRVQAWLPSTRRKLLGSFLAASSKNPPARPRDALPCRRGCSGRERGAGQRWRQLMLPNAVT